MGIGDPWGDDNLDVAAFKEYLRLANSIDTPEWQE